MVFVFFILMIFSSEIPQEFRGFFSAVGWAGSILAGINLLFRIRRMIRPRPLLIANTEGLFDFSLPSGVYFLGGNKQYYARFRPWGTIRRGGNSPYS